MEDFWVENVERVGRYTLDGMTECECSMRQI